MIDSQVKRILLVEDDQSLGVTMRERLEKEHYQVILCHSLAEARSVRFWNFYVLNPKPNLCLQYHGKPERAAGTS